MFKTFELEGPPIFVEIYVDGRAYAKAPDPYTLREIALFKMLTKGLKAKEIYGMKPGRYHWNFTKVGRFHCEAELTPIE